jgi:Tol biopolymer transport system component
MRKQSIILILAISFLLGLSNKAYSEIAYSSNRSGTGYDIWVMDDNGENKIQLTITPWNEFAPRWSPDGEKIVYYSNHSGNYDIWIMNSDGSNQTSLTSHSSTDKEPTWTPDGSKILFYSTRSWNGDIWIMNSDGSNQTRLTYKSGKTGRDGIDVSLDGSKIVYTSQPTGHNWGYNGELYISDITLTENADTCTVSIATRLSFDSEHDLYPRFTPDGVSIIWSAGRNNPYGHCATNCYFSTYELFSINIDGTNENRITINTVTGDLIGSITTDSNNIFFYSDRSAGSPHVSNKYDIWTCGINGGNLVQLTDNSFSDIKPDWKEPANLPPVAQCKDVELIADENCQAFITPEDVNDGSYDPDDDPIELSVDNIGPFSLGEHYVNLTIRDDSGESDTCQAIVTVIDTTPPEISLSLSPDILQPPNHKMVLITPTITVSDSCDSAPEVLLTSITMNEGDETNTYDPDYDSNEGDGNTFNDIHVDANGNIYLRAERSGKGTGRIYTITYTVTDASGNSASAIATVTVPHDKSLS